MIKKSAPGILFPVYLRPNTTDEALYSDILLQDEYGYIEMLKQPKVIIDAGANIGLSAIYFANKYKDAMIISIEPEDDNFSVLKKNVSPYKNIYPIKAALWPQDGMVSLHDPGLGVLGYRTCYNPESIEENDIHCVTIDSLITEFKIDCIDILKIDIEGSEEELFNANCPWISKVSVLIAELHERFKPGCNKAFFAAAKDYFSYEWIGGENFYLSNQGVAKPVIPLLFKHDNPDLLPIEYLWEAQAQLNETNRIFTISSLYQDLGQGFIEDDKLIADVNHCNDQFTVSYLIDGTKVKALRFDPCETFCKVWDIRVSSNAEIGIEPVNASYIEHSNSYFMHNDPIYYLTFSQLPESMFSIKITGRIANLSPQEITEYYKKIEAALNDQIFCAQNKLIETNIENRKSKTLSDESLKTENLYKYLYESRVPDLERQISDLLNLKSYRITKPLRSLRYHISKLFH